MNRSINVPGKTHLLLALAAAVVIAAVLWSASTYTLRASIAASGNIPELITYQGVLSNDQGPYTGSVPMTFAIYDLQSGGTKIWEETHASVQVSGGYFTVVLGSQGQPLGSSVFSGIERWLQTSVDMGAGVVTLPRQQLHSVPFALRAYAAETASHATTATSATTASSATTATSATTALTATVAISALSAPAADGLPFAYMVTVAKSGGDYTSVQAALDSITTASATTPYVVWVAPGVYEETELVRVPAYVHLKGASVRSVLIRSTRSDTAQTANSAAVEILDNSRISDLRIENTGAGSNYAIGIYAQTPVSRAAVVDNVEVIVNGAGGVGHFGVYLNDAEPTFRDSQFTASGANAAISVNAGLGSVNSAGGFPQALIENSMFRGIGSNSGYGLFMTESAPTIRFSTIHGDFRGIMATNNGLVSVEASQLQEGGFTDSYLVESTASAAVKIAASQVLYLAGHKHTGTGGLICIHSYKGNFQAAVDSATAATACN